ncbi:MAG: hypothetical protein D6702_08825 [Planctomycetota bacterium]|nr:MAG: hypothetical protein D6702_08825 [Planctomycetota bacterium]
MSPTRQDQRSAPAPAIGRPLVHRPVDQAGSLEELFSGSLPSFGGGYLRRVWELLDEAIGRGVPMTLAVAGPVTASGQHYAWLNPLLDTGWFAWISVTDAICYHDLHRALASVRESDFREVPIHGDDARLRDDAVIRITDIGFPEEVLLDTDAALQEILRRPEFQQRMSGPVFRHRLGAAAAELEAARGAQEGLLALCRRKAIPVFVGAPADGSVFLNSVALWADARSSGAPHALELDLHEEVFESCAYHWWGLRESPTRALGTLILGGGVPKNFNLQPEPALGQVLGFPDITGYLYDIQITTAPVTDGSLSSCPPAEAVTWGKVDKEHYRSTTVSFHCDYSVVMPLLVKALLEKRARLAARAEAEGREAVLAAEPAAAGYLRPPDGYRLFEQRERLIAALLAERRRRREG